MNTSQVLVVNSLLGSRDFSDFQCSMEVMTVQPCEVATQVIIMLAFKVSTVLKV